MKGKWGRWLEEYRRRRRDIWFCHLTYLLLVCHKLHFAIFLFMFPFFLIAQISFCCVYLEFFLVHSKFYLKKPRYNLKFIFSIQGSLDLQKKISPPLKRPSTSLDFDNPTGQSNGTADLFGLLHIHDKKQDSSVPPPSWTTFDCKMTVLVSCIVLNLSSIFFYSFG